MASVTQKVNNYVLGMSEQPDELKQPGQVNNLKNGVPDITRGLVKRPGSELVSTLTPLTIDKSKWFHIYTDKDEQYIGQIQNNGITKVWRCSDGVEIPIDYAQVLGTGQCTYLDNSLISTSTSADIQPLTINQSTFICNRQTNVTMMTDGKDKSPPVVHEAFIKLDKISYGKQYALDIYDPADNTTYTFDRATQIAALDSVDTNGILDYEDSDTSRGYGSGKCQAMGRETVAPNKIGTAVWDTSPPNSSAAGSSNLKYELDTRCQAVQIATDGNGDDYIDSYHPFADLQFGGEGWKAGTGAVTFTQIRDVGNNNYNPGASTYSNNTACFTGGGGSGAAATVNFSGSGSTESLVSVLLTNGGSGYTSAPTFNANNISGVSGGTGTEVYVSTNNLHEHTSRKGLKTWVEITKSEEIKSRANIAMIRPPATSANADEHVSAASIASSLKVAIDGITGHGITATIVGNGVHLYRSQPFGVSTPEKALMDIITTESKSIDDLPTSGRHGHVVRMVQSEGEEDDYYLQFRVSSIIDDIVQKATYARAGSTVTVTSNGHGLANGQTVIASIMDGGATDGMYTIGGVTANTFTYTDSASGTIAAGKNVIIQPCRYGEGQWEECPAPGINVKINPDTMPVQLTRVLPIDKTYTIATSAVNTSTEIITITAHGLVTGDPIRYSNGGGTTLAPLSNNSTYYAVYVDANSIKIAGSLANALAGTTYNLSGTGNNAQTFKRYVDLNGVGADISTTGAFRYQNPDWGQRDVGDDITNPQPSFVNNPIQRMIFWRNRIVLLSAENAICSRAGGEFYNFWAKTAMTVSNQDPIDLQSSSTYPTKLYDAVESNSGLVLFSASEQFLLSAGGEATLTPDTAKISFLSAYAYDSNTRPFSLGTSVGFLNSTAKNTRFYEMANILSGGRGEPDVLEQSKVVSNLFPKNSSMPAVSTQNDLVLFAVDRTLHTPTNEVWGYRFFNQGQKRIQSAWFKWELPNNIIFHTIMDDVYYAVLNTGSTYTLEKFDIRLSPTTLLVGTEPDTNRIHLDTKKTIASSALTYTQATHVTTFTLGAGYYSTNTLTAYIRASGDQEGRSYDIPASSISGTAPNQTVTLPGNWKNYVNAAGATINTDIIVGYEYEYEVELPRIYVTKRDGEKIRSQTRGSLVVHRMNFDFGDVGVIDVTLKRRGRNDYTKTYESLEWDSIRSNTAAIADGYTHTVPVYDRNTNLTVHLKSNHPSPATLHSMNWEGDYSNKFYQSV